MERNGLIIINGYKLIDSMKYVSDRLTEEFGKRGVSITIKKTTEILAGIADGKASGPDLPYDFAIFLDKDSYISHLLEMRGLRIFNKADPIEACDDKMKTYVALVGKGIRMPNTVSGPLNYSGKNDPEFVENLEKAIPFPIVVKENFGSQGSKVYLAKNHEELASLEAKITANPRLFQEMIESSWGVDYRLIVIGGKYITGMKRSSLTGDFRSNIGLGGKGEFVQMPDAFIAMAEKVANLLNLDYCGVDILKGPNGEPVLCEVNSNAFFMKAEEVTGVNIAGAYANHVLKTIY